MSEIDKRKILIASPQADETRFLTSYFEEKVAKSQIITAADGAEAQAKIENDPPLVAFLNQDLQKKNTLSLVQWILDQKKYSNLAVVILSAIPDHEHFVDDVTTGRVQFCEPYSDEKKLSEVLHRALNYGANGTPREFKLRFLVPNEVLIRKDEKAETVYIVRQGTLKAMIKRDGQNLCLGQIEPGEFVGEMAYINGEPRSADVIAETDCELIEIPIDSLDHMLFQKPAWAKALMKTLSKRVKQGNRIKTSAA